MPAGLTQCLQSIMKKKLFSLYRRMGGCPTQTIFLLLLFLFLFSNLSLWILIIHAEWFSPTQQCHNSLSKSLHLHRLNFLKGVPLWSRNLKNALKLGECVKNICVPCICLYPINRNRTLFNTSLILNRFYSKFFGISHRARSSGAKQYIQREISVEFCVEPARTKVVVWRSLIGFTKQLKGSLRA